MGITRLKFIPVLIAYLFASLQGCSVIPVPYLISGQKTHGETGETVGSCEPDLLAGLSADTTKAASALNPEGFSLMSWNVFKGRRKGWGKDFSKFSQGSDVILLQEAYLTKELRNTLRSAKVNWKLVTAIRYWGKESGVLTASKIAPEVICMHRFDEPFLNTPKTSLFTRFSILSQRPYLVIVNVHAVNFAVDTAYYQNYWQELETILESHDGPLIVAGDFNTWNAERLAIVANMARRLRLQPVRFELDRRTRFFGQVVDHVYYRGLIPSKAAVYEVATSDHNPIQVSFKLADAY